MFVFGGSVGLKKSFRLCLTFSTYTHTFFTDTSGKRFGHHTYNISIQVPSLPMPPHYLLSKYSGEGGGEALNHRWWSQGIHSVKFFLEILQFLFQKTFWSKDRFTFFSSFWLIFCLLCTALNRCSTNRWNFKWLFDN